MSGGADETRQCRKCGEDLYDVGWLFDPCPASKDGDHQEARRYAARTWRAAKAVWAFARKRCPKWLLPVLAACLFIPGPVDELLVLAVVAFPVLRSREARAELVGMIRQAWNA